MKRAEKATVWASLAERQEPVTVPRLWWHSHITESSASSAAHSMSWFRDSGTEQREKTDTRTCNLVSLKSHILYGTRSRDRLKDARQRLSRGDGVTDMTRTWRERGTALGATNCTSSGVCTVPSIYSSTWPCLILSILIGPGFLSMDECDRIVEWERLPACVHVGIAVRCVETVINVAWGGRGALKGQEVPVWRGSSSVRFIYIGQNPLGTLYGAL